MLILHSNSVGSLKVNSQKNLYPRSNSKILIHNWRYTAQGQIVRLVYQSNRSLHVLITRNCLNEHNFPYGSPKYLKYVLCLEITSYLSHWTIERYNIFIAHHIAPTFNATYRGPFGSVWIWHWSVAVHSRKFIMVHNSFVCFLVLCFAIGVPCGGCLVHENDSCIRSNP